MNSQSTETEALKQSVKSSKDRETMLRLANKQSVHLHAGNFISFVTVDMQQQQVIQALLLHGCP